VTYMTDTGRIANVFNFWFAGGSAVSTPTTPFKLRLMTAMGSGNGNVAGSNGTELTSATGYTAGGSSLGSSPTFSTFSSASPAAVTNSNAVSWSAGSTWTTVVGIEIWDSTGTPARYLQGTTTSSITGVVNGDTVQFAAGSISANPSAW